MQNQLPQFQYHTKGDLKNHFGHIKANGVVLHWIKNLDEFYRALGYTDDMAKRLIAPDEFIWEEYIKDGAVNSTACLQSNIIAYLSNHSDNFVKKYGDQYDNLIAGNVDAKTEKDKMCLSCSMNQFCTDSTSDRNPMHFLNEKSKR